MKRYVAVFIDTSALIESMRFDQWVSLPFDTARLLIPWRAIKELDKRKAMAGWRGKRCRDLLAALRSDSGIVTGGGFVVEPYERSINSGTVEHYGLDPGEADDWILAEAEKFRQANLGPTPVRVGLLSGDNVLAIKAKYLKSFQYLDFIDLPDSLRSADARRGSKRLVSEEEKRMRRAIGELMDAAKACLGETGQP